jgi:hypothetical protein
MVALRLIYAVLAIANLSYNYLGGRLEAYESGFKAALTFFGVHLLLLGSLLLKSQLMPRVLGVLMLFAGCAYLADAVAVFLFPLLHSRIALYLAVPESFEILLAVWLVVFGVRQSA